MLLRGREIHITLDVEDIRKVMGREGVLMIVLEVDDKFQVKVTQGKHVRT